ncbi:MAG: HAD family hydrolase, partial [Halobacteria archaeon]|nr:HAD family hydrolase [Halobacteria archaeon]
ILEINRDLVDAFRNMIASTFAEFGVENPSEDEIDTFLGDLDTDEMRNVCKHHDIDLREFWYRREMNSTEVQRELINDGARGLYDDADFLRQLEHPAGVVSNNQHSTVEY